MIGYPILIFMVIFGMYVMNKKGLEVLTSLIKNDLSKYIKYVIGAKDKNVINDYYSEIKHLCEVCKIDFYDKNEKKQLLIVDYRIAIGWRWLIKDSKNLIILHDSLLPKYRGFSPLVNSLINGEKKIGVTALFADKEYDKGDVIQQEFAEITYPIKISKAIDIISKLYSKITCELIDKVQTAIIKASKQNERDASYSLWRDNDDYFINWNWGSDYIERFVDSLGYLDIPVILCQ